MENWRDVVGYEGIYQVSDLGRVRRVLPAVGTEPGRVLKPQTMKSGGYQSVRLYNDKGSTVTNNPRWKKRWMHHLVLEAFVALRPDDTSEGNHKDGNPFNNHAENLEWVTRADNLRHAYTHLNHAERLPRGADHHHSRFTENDIREIRQLNEGGMSQNAIAKKFATKQAVIWRIVHRKTWCHIT